MFDFIKKKLNKVLNEDLPEKNILSKISEKITSTEVSIEKFNEIFEEIEIFLLEINVSYEIVQKIKESLEKKIVGNKFSRFSLSSKIKEILNEYTCKVLENREEDFFKKFNEIKKENGLVKILVLGVNGVGKTTTIAKLLHNLKEKGLKTVVSASDTFRAAAVEQLENHCVKIGIKIIKHKSGGDPSAVCFDSIEHAKSKKLDCVIIDTAGRQPNNDNLINEIKKIKRVSNPDFTLFVGDINSGSDLLEQFDKFEEKIGVNGIILTKVDTDKTPGSILTLSKHIEKPIYFLGFGQEYKDLSEFSAKNISKMLFLD